MNSESGPVRLNPADFAGMDLHDAFNRALEILYPDGRYDDHLENCAYLVEHMPRERAVAWRQELIDLGDKADPLVIDLLDDKLAGKRVSDIPFLG